MALIDVVKWEGSIEQFVWKFPSENLRLGSQLVVKPGQWALFVKGGQLLDVFEEGTTTLETNNLPLLTRLMSLPFGGNTPFQAEVWFINKLSKLNNKFGTPAPLQLEDPKYGLIVPIRAFGQYGFRVSDPKMFLSTLTGTARVFGAEKICEYFRGRVVSALASIIGQSLVAKGLSIIQIVAHLDELSLFCQEKISAEFAKYGLEVVSFYFESINFSTTDPSYLKLKQIKEKAAELNIIGRDIYQYDKSMDVLKTAAGNEGAGNSLMQTGIGLSMGLAVGNQIGQQAGQMVTNLPPQNTFVPPTPSAAPAPLFYVVVGAQRLGPFPVEMLQQMIPAGTFSPASLVWRTGMAGWLAAGCVQELSGLFAPPPIPTPLEPPPIPSFA
jgi:membrane protease subunit (stomatin/prohibitin family)